MLELVVNGRFVQLDGADERSLKDVLLDLAVDTAAVAVELNGLVVYPDKIDLTLVQSGAKLEILKFIGGG